MNRSKLFFLIINLIASFAVSAQSVSDIVKFADNQFEQENYAIASKEYNRALFFGSENSDIISLQIAHCYQQLSEYELSSNFYDKAYRLSTNDSIKAEAILGKTFCLILEKKFILAMNELFNIPENITPQQKIQYHFLNGISSYGIHDDSTSYNEFLKVLQLSSISAEETTALQSEFQKVHRYDKRYNPNRAYIMSGIIPGSGQLSSGAIKDGVNSFLLVGGLFLISVRMIGLYSFWDTVISILPWIQRYYMGGMDKAEGLAISKIEEKRNESYLKILDLTAPKDFK